MLQRNHLEHTSKPTGNVRLSTSSASRYLYNSVVAPSGPGALLVFNDREAALTSSGEKSVVVMFRFVRIS